MTTVRPIDNLKHDGSWAVLSDGRLKLDLTGPSGGAIPMGVFTLHWNGKDSLTLSSEGERDEHWTRQ